MFRKSLLAVTLLLAAMALAAVFAETGPSSSQTPYLNAVAPGVEFISILTTGDAVIQYKEKGKDKDKNKDEDKEKGKDKDKDKGGDEDSSMDSYRMSGIPDGLGAYDSGDGTFTVLMNHEIRANGGVPRLHGGVGAFVSKWQIRKSDLKVLNGQDLMQSVMLWNPIGQTYVDGNGTAFSRFCSADLAPTTAFYNKKTKKGLKKGRIFMNGEEDDATGRAMAHLVDGHQEGTSYELPKLGRHAWENLLSSPYPQDKTILVATEDGGLNKVFIYIGEKQNEGSPIEMAGLTNGALYELNIAGYTNDDPVTGFKAGLFSLAGSGGTSLARPEDGAWDTVNPNRFYFATTANITGNSRLWRMTFYDITRPELGGTLRSWWMATSLRFHRSR